MRRDANGFSPILLHERVRIDFGVTTQVPFILVLEAHTTLTRLFPDPRPTLLSAAAVIAPSQSR